MRHLQTANTFLATGNLSETGLPAHHLQMRLPDFAYKVTSGLVALDLRGSVDLVPVRSYLARRNLVPLRGVLREAALPIKRLEKKLIV